MVFFPAIMGPPGTIMTPGLPQSHPQLPPPFSQPQGGPQVTSYHMGASAIQHLSAHGTATQTKTSTGDE